MTEYTALKIKRIMKEKNIGNKALSELSGLPIGTLNKIIYGETKSPTLDNMQAIARALGCTLDDFVESDSDPKKGQQGDYYLNPEVAAKAQEIYEDSGARILLDAKRDLSAEDLDVVLNMIKALKAKENHND